MGAGAVGGYYGIRLAEAGNDVYLVARGKHLEEIQHNGLRVTSLFGNFHRNLPASDNPSDFGIHPDLLMFAVKSFDTQGAIEQVRPVVGERTQILAIQNGVENYTLLVNAFGKERVIRSYCRVSAELVAPGYIEQTRFGQVVFGEDNGEKSERIFWLEGLFRDAGVETLIPDDIVRDVWIKFIWNTVYNVLTALTLRTIDQLYADSRTVELMKRMAAEIISVARAEGVNITIDDALHIVEEGRKLTAYRTSTLMDREQGKRLEFEAFTGAMVRLGEKHGIQVPEYRTIDALFRSL